MIAAGSLFTSCVTNTEPQGIKDLREAKADYLASLSKLREADADLVKAKAAYKDAETAYKNAETALKQAKVKAAEIKNSKADAEAKAYIDSIVAHAKITAVNQEKELAKAEAALEKTLRNIAVTSQSLTDKEKAAVDSFTVAYGKYIEALNAVRVAERTAYDKAESREAFILDQQEISASSLAKIAKYEELIKNLPDSGKSVADSAAFYAKLKKDSIELNYKIANLQKEWNLYEQTEVDPQIKGFAEELGQWVAKNAALPAPFMMHYKAELPDNDQVVELLWKYTTTEDVIPAEKANGEEHKYTPKYSGIEVYKEKKVLTANFNSSPEANDGIKALAKIIDGLSRERVVDSTKFAYDTTGMSAAIDTLKKEYNTVYTALSKGIGAYEGIADAQAKAKTAKEAKEAAQKKFEADTANLLGSIRAFVKLWNEVAAAEEDGELVSTRKQNDSLDIFNALKDIMTYRKAVFGKDTCFAYYRNVDDDTVKVLVPFTELEFSGIRPNKNGHVPYTGSYTEGSGAFTWDEDMNAFAAILDAAFGKEDFFADLMTVTGATTYISEIEDLLTATEKYKTLFFNTYRVNSKNIIWQDNVGAYVPSAVIKAESDYTKAVAAIKTAKEDYYRDIYCTYWGIKYNELEASEYFDKDKVAFKDNGADSLRLKDFTYATYTDPTTIAKFTPVDKPYNSKDSTFAETLFTKYEGVNPQFTIVWNEFVGKQGSTVKDQVKFDNLLIARLLCAEQIKASFSTGSEGVSAALAALQDIYVDMVAEYAVALKAQSENSKPFYTFIEGLVGKDCLDHVFAALDSALTVYAQYAPARPEGANQWVDLANAIAAKEITAKEALIVYFEKFMCGEFDFNGIIGKIEDVVESNIYRTAYIALQVADAVPGEQIRVLLSDVLTAFINSLKIDVVGWNKALAEVTGTDNIIEKILFGTERVLFPFNFDEPSVDPSEPAVDSAAVEDITEQAAAVALNSSKDRKQGVVVSIAIKLVAPILVPYILNDLGGELGDLEEKYLSEWGEKWVEFDLKAAELAGEKEALKKAEKIYKDYFDGIIDLRKVYHEYKAEIAAATVAYNDACDHLAKIEAGVSWYTIFSEAANDALEAAKVALETAEAKLATAEAAYKQVLANHGLDE